MFYERLKLICDNKNLTPTKVVKDLGLSSSKVTAWKNGSNPKADIILKIADYLDCSVDYLLGREDKKSLTVSNTGDISNSVVGSINSAVHINSEINDIGREIINVCNSLDIKSQVKVLQYAYELEEEQK